MLLEVVVPMLDCFGAVQPGVRSRFGPCFGPDRGDVVVPRPVPGAFGPWRGVKGTFSLVVRLDDGCRSNLGGLWLVACWETRHIRETIRLRRTRVSVGRKEGNGIDWVRTLAPQPVRFLCRSPRIGRWRPDLPRTSLISGQTRGRLPVSQVD